MDTIYRERLRPTAPHLGRHVNHDSRSRRYEFPTGDLTLKSVRHERHVPVFNQGNIGSCTGNAGVGCLATGDFFNVHGTHYSLDEAGAVALYGDATRLDVWPGEYPPTDTGSDGLSVAKALVAAGEIAGYQHTFSLDAALRALTVTPFITGTNWYRDMFDVDTSGRVRLTGSLVGGHEYVADRLDVESEQIWFTNSWGEDWGVSGRFWMTWADYGALLAQDGDVTVFTPLTQPAPVPTPVPADPVDVELATQVRAWANARHVRSNGKAAKAVREWLARKGL